ncbi:hypothetical protein [Nostoc sp. WHI]|uniref:hypothetical protein n=1 Tax=Nostoc sp. WHI TaxID=2650611 RepID=UPI0018C7E9FE|nr:hypothetical protein [Nostoc sp. WHI]MBG1265501.1 hypothetical protein [Nostoc sp. WHI]
MIQSEQELKRSFIPLTSNKDGKSQLTFGGYKHSVNKYDNPYLRIVFSCLDVTHQNPKNIGINASYSYSESNLLGKLLKTMGYVHKIETVIVDETDEFGYKVDENLNDIYDFLDSQRGLLFKGSLFQKPDKVFYELDVLTLEQILDKQGNQKRAYEAVDGLSGDQLTVDIEAGGDISVN